MLLPGTLCDARVFAPVLDRLPDVEVMTPAIVDARSTTQLAERLLREAPLRFALAGFSLGGIVALEMAAQAPDRIAGLALLNTNPLTVPAEAHAARREAVVEAARVGVDAYVHQALWPNYVSSAAAERDDLKTLVTDMAVTLGPEVFASQTEVALSRIDRRTDLQRLDAPILILTGAHDVVCHPDLQRDLADALPRARFVAVPKTGHFALLEAPDDVALHLRTWLEDVRTHMASQMFHRTADIRRNA